MNTHSTYRITVEIEGKGEEEEEEKETETETKEEAKKKAPDAKANLVVIDPTDPKNRLFSSSAIAGRLSVEFNDKNFASAIEEKADSIPEETWAKLILIPPAIKNCVALAAGGS